MVMLSKIFLSLKMLPRNVLFDLRQVFTLLSFSNTLPSSSTNISFLPVAPKWYFCIHRCRTTHVPLNFSTSPILHVFCESNCRDERTVIYYDPGPSLNLVQKNYYCEVQVQMKPKKLTKYRCLTTKPPQFFSINSVQIRSRISIFEAIYIPDPKPKNRHSPYQVQSKSSQMLRLVHGNVIPMGIPWDGMGQA